MYAIAPLFLLCAACLRPIVAQALEGMAAAFSEPRR